MFRRFRPRASFAPADRLPARPDRCRRGRRVQTDSVEGARWSRRPRGTTRHRRRPRRPTSDGRRARVRRAHRRTRDDRATPSPRARERGSTVAECTRGARPRFRATRLTVVAAFARCGAPQPCCTVEVEDDRGTVEDDRVRNAAGRRSRALRSPHWRGTWPVRSSAIRAPTACGSRRRCWISSSWPWQSAWIGSPASLRSRCAVRCWRASKASSSSGAAAPARRAGRP